MYNIFRDRIVMNPRSHRKREKIRSLYLLAKGCMIVFFIYNIYVLGMSFLCS